MDEIIEAIEAATPKYNGSDYFNYGAEMVNKFKKQVIDIIRNYPTSSPDIREKLKAVRNLIILNEEAVALTRLDALIAELEKGEHALYTDADKDAPSQIKDRNGEVVLGLCKKCGKAEIELSESCTPSQQQPASSLVEALQSIKNTGYVPPDVSIDARSLLILLLSVCGDYFNYCFFA